MLSDLDALKDKRKVRAVVKVLNDHAAGKKVSAVRLEKAQVFLANFLGEIVSKRPRPEIRCTP
jgi:hypothetical protein